MFLQLQTLGRHASRPVAAGVPLSWKSSPVGKPTLGDLGVGAPLVLTVAAAAIGLGFDTAAVDSAHQQPPKGMGFWT